MNVLQKTKAFFKRNEAKIYTVATVATVGISQAHAAEALNMGAATEQLGLGLAAVGALGAAKLAPAALSWVWTLVTRVAQR